MFGIVRKLIRHANPIRRSFLYISYLAIDLGRCWVREVRRTLLHRRPTCSGVIIPGTTQETAGCAQNKFERGLWQASRGISNDGFHLFNVFQIGAVFLTGPGFSDNRFQRKRYRVGVVRRGVLRTTVVGRQRRSRFQRRSPSQVSPYLV